MLPPDNISRLCTADVVSSASTEMNTISPAFGAVIKFEPICNSVLFSIPVLNSFSSTIAICPLDAVAAFAMWYAMIIGSPALTQ